MNITVNGTTVHQEVKRGSTLEDILVGITNSAFPPDHLLGVVKVNGEDFSEQYPGQAQDVGEEEVYDLEIHSVSPEKFARAALQDGSRLLQHIAVSISRTAELFRMHDESEANQHFVNLIDSLRAMFQFIDTARKSTNWDFKKESSKGLLIENEWKQLQDIVDSLKNTHEECDWVFLADLLEYELAPLISRWKDILEERSRLYQSA